MKTYSKKNQISIIFAVHLLHFDVERVKQKTLIGLFLDGKKYFDD